MHCEAHVYSNVGPRTTRERAVSPSWGIEVENQLRISITMLFARDRRANAQWAYGPTTLCI